MSPTVPLDHGGTATYDGIRYLRLHLVRRSAKASGGSAALTELANTKVCIATVLSNAANRLTIERR